ncbi:ABC transporter permease [Anaerolinea sp.]|uniref:ABC transporter permease n=1 Tax=Anaerolinea sp. TaxID=1872519 RepID=UPI002ACE1055|nr:ABC transporter permease [Anaerolinea sp.]
MSAVSLKNNTEKSTERWSPTREAWRRLRRHRSAQIGMIILGLMVLVAIFAPLIAPYDPVKQMQDVKRREPPCIHLLGCPADKPQHIFGVDGNFRDLFSRVVFGSRLSLQIGFATIGFAILVGGLLGAISAYAGGWVDNLIMRIMDVLMAFPSLLLAIAIVAVLGTGLINALLAIGIVSIPRYARLVRATVLQVREMEYVQASRALGAGGLHILFLRILPNAITPLIVQGTLGIAGAIIDAAALSFLGLGAEPPTPEWGLMLGEERNSVFNAPHLVFFPGLAIMLTVLSFNLLGDGLRDALDPRLRGSVS